jgi:hypothetical protein
MRSDPALSDAMTSLPGDRNDVVRFNALAGLVRLANVCGAEESGGAPGHRRVLKDGQGEYCLNCRKAVLFSRWRTSRPTAIRNRPLGIECRPRAGSLFISSYFAPIPLQRSSCQ